MAGEYYKWLARDVKPREHRELSPAEKRRNWWHYHKYHVLVGLLLVSIGASLVCSYLGIGQTKPDYAIAYVGTRSLSEAGVLALQNAFAALGTDENGDGEIAVAVNQYVSHSTGDSDSLYYAQAAAVQIIGDISGCDSFFFLLEDPDGFQAQMHVLCYPDGSLPAADNFSAEGMTFLTENCPALGTLPQELHGLSLGRRGFWNDETTQHPEGCARLWAALTEGSN